MSDNFFGRGLSVTAGYTDIKSFKFILVMLGPILQGRKGIFYFCNKVLAPLQTTTPTAPFLKASIIKLCPSKLGPIIAKNRSPGIKVRLSMEILFIEQS